MAHPYRTTPREPPPPPSDRLEGATIAFGFLCVVFAHAIGGPKVLLVAMLGSVALIFARPRA